MVGHHMARWLIGSRARGSPRFSWGLYVVAIPLLRDAHGNAGADIRNERCYFPSDLYTKRTNCPRLMVRNRTYGGPIPRGGKPIMNSKSRIVRGALLAVTVALAVAAVPAAGGAADAGSTHGSQRAILRAIL
jgi:hypothetical protein